MLSSFTNFERYPNIGYSPLSKDGGWEKPPRSRSSHLYPVSPLCSAKAICGQAAGFHPPGADVSAGQAQQSSGWMSHPPLRS